MAEAGKSVAALERCWAAVGQRCAPSRNRGRRAGEPVSSLRRADVPLRTPQGRATARTVAHVRGRRQTATKVIPAAAMNRTKRQIAERRRFRDMVRELVEVGERLCEARLSDAPQRGRRKGGSRRPSRRRPSARSRRSSGPA